MNVDCINVITLAYMGDAIYEVYIRERVIRSGVVKVEELQKIVTSYVSAKGQANALNKLIKKEIFTENELEIIKRGRNYKRSVHPKHTDLATYKLATGFETLLGYLYLSKNNKRLEEILEMIEVMPCIYTEKML